MKKIILIYLFILIVISIFSQTLDPPVANNINSDYGPRQLSKYDWHGGIDYASPQWTAVEAVEGGDITVINYEIPGDKVTAGYYISIQGTNGRWTYMHLFNDSTNPQYGNWEVRMATLENPENPLQCVNTYVFINWSSRDNNIANTVLTPYMVENQIVTHWYVQSRSTDPGYDPDNPYIFDINGDPILTQGSVEEGEVIGLSGNSGNVGAHLHVSASSLTGHYDINPLYYIKHTTPSYTFNILKPLDKEILYHIPNVDSTKQIYERVKVYINSSTGRDLDKVKLYLFDKNEKYTFDDNHLLKKIIYGGLSTGEESSPYPSYIAKDGDVNKGSYNKTGISPAYTSEDPPCGLDTIYFINLQTDINTEGSRAKLNKYAKYKDGLKDMVIRAHSINSKIFTSEKREFILDNFVPYISNIAIYQNFEQQYVAGYYTTETSIEEIEIEKDEGIDPEGIFKIEINFSEEMDVNKKPEVYVSNGTERCKETSGLWKNNRQYESTISSVDKKIYKMTLQKILI